MMGPYVEGLSKLIVKNFDDINTLIDEGELHFEIRTLYCALRGKGGGVPWVQIMENQFEYLADRGGHGGHLGEKFVNKDCS